jgi:hypothetical protein
MADLTWKVSEIKYNCDTLGNNWVHVEPSTGVGSQDIEVIVRAATSQNDCDSATITISASTGDIQKIPVTRCLPQCSCQSMGFYGEELNNLDSSGEAHKKIGEYDSSSTCSNSMNIVTDGIVLTNPSKDGGNIYADVNPNNGDARTGWYRFLFDGEICLEKIVTQRRGVDPCEIGDCSSISVTFEGGNTSIQVDNEGGTYRFTTSYSSDCWSLTKTSKSENWLSVNENSITVAENGGSSPTRSGYVTFTFTNNKTGSTCKPKLTITQDNKPEPTPTCEIDGPDEIDSCSGGTAQYEITQS